MTATNPPLTLDAVLDLFQMEEVHDGDVLARYIGEHPQFALQLIDFSRLIATPNFEDEGGLSAKEQSRIDAAWITHKAARSNIATGADPLARLSGDVGKALATKLGVPRQVITCIREHRVIASSVPGFVTRELSGALGVPPAHVIAAMARPPAGMAVTRSYKSDRSPGSAVQTTFEQILKDAGVSESDRARLLVDD
jgi:hypothetical protein